MAGGLPAARMLPPQQQSGGLPSGELLPPPGPPTWRFVKRYTISIASIDTTPLGDILVPTQAVHLMVEWEAIDNTANTGAAFGGLQLGTNNGAINTGNNYAWTDYSNANGGAPTGTGANPAASWAAFVTTGGGTGAAWRSKGTIKMLGVQDTSQTPKATWETVQINNGTVVRRSGAGYVNFGGAVTKLHFFAGAGLLAPGTYFELWAAYAA